MKFSADHEFPAHAELVAMLMVDPEFEVNVELPDLSRPEIVEHTVDGAVTVLALRYEFTGYIEPIAKKVIAGQRLTWVQRLELDMTELRGEMSIVFDSQPDRVRANATVALRDVADGCVRSIAGDFVVKIPLLGGKAEQAIVPGVLTRLDAEADAIRADLS